MHPNLLVVILISAAALVAGCQSTSKPGGATTPLAGTDWTLVELNGRPTPVIEGLRTPTLVLDEPTHRAAGTSGINRYSVSYEQDGAHLTFGMFLGTRMAGPPEAMAYESEFLKAMDLVSAWRINGGNLELMSDEKTVARFAPAAPSLNQSTTN